MVPIGYFEIGDEIVSIKWKMSPDKSVLLVALQTDTIIFIDMENLPEETVPDLKLSIHDFVTQRVKIGSLLCEEDMGHNLILSSAHTDKWPIFVAKIELPSLLKEATYRVVLLMATFLWLVIMAYTRNERIKFSLCFSTFVILTVDCSMSKYSRGWSLGNP